MKWNFAVVSPRIVGIEDGALCFATKLRTVGRVKLVPNSQRQRKLLEQAENKHWQVGQSIVTPKWAVVPLTRYLNLASEREPIMKELLSETRQRS